MAGKPSAHNEPAPPAQGAPPGIFTPTPNIFWQEYPVAEAGSFTSLYAWFPVTNSGTPSRSMSAMALSVPSPLPPMEPPSFVCGQSVLPVAASNTPLPAITCAGPSGPRSRAIAGAPHQSEAPRLTQRNLPSLPKAINPPLSCAWPGFSVGLQPTLGPFGLQGMSYGSQPPVMKQSSPVPMQSPAAIPALPFTLCSMCDHMRLGAVQIAEPSEPRTARITPCVSTRVPAPPSEKVLNTTAGSASFGCKRITTGVLMTCTKSGYSRSARTLRL